MPVDAGADSASDGAVSVDGCVPGTVETSVPTATDRCRWATPLAWSHGAVRFGALESPEFAVSASYLFFVARGQLWRVPRSNWLASGGGSLEQCNETMLGPVVGTAVRQILPFDTDGVCVHVAAGGRDSVQCAGNDDPVLRDVPSLGRDEGDAGTVAANGGAITTRAGYLVFARTNGQAFRYAAGDSAPIALSLDDSEFFDTLGPLSAISDGIVASRFCGGCSPNLMSFDPLTLSGAREGRTLPWPDGSPVLSFSGQLHGDLLGRHQNRTVRLLAGSGTELFRDTSLLVGPRSGASSFVVTVPVASADGGAATPANFEIVTPTELGIPFGDANTPRHRSPALLAADKHRAVIDNDDLFVSTMPAFGCTPEMAWIAKLPRLLQ